MNDEIKEILDKLQKVANRETASRNALMEMKDKDYQLLLDYITNLQQEIKEANESVEWWTNRFKAVEKENQILKENAIHNDKVVDKAKWNETIYKTRIDKAIKLIESYNLGKYDYTIPPDGIIELLDILKGDSND